MSPTCGEVVQVAATLAKHIQACSCNAYEVNEFIRRGHSLIDCTNVELGGAVYPSISLSNHSCAANTSRTNYGRAGVVRAVRTINKVRYLHHLRLSKHNNIYIHNIIILISITRMRECMTTTATSTTPTHGSRGRPCCRRSTSSHARARL